MKIIIKYYAVFTALFSSIIYLTTIAPSVIQIDSGELATVQIKLGIAHPTGYPLFTIIGYLFSLIPLFNSKIFQMNFLALIFVSLSVGLFTFTVKTLLDNINFFRKENISLNKKKSKQIKVESIDLSDIEKIFISFTSGLVLAFSKTFWFQSTSVEVYSLQILLFSLLIVFLIKAFSVNDGKDKYWYFFSVILGLGFSNHMSTLFILPATAYIYLLLNRLNSNSFKKLFIMILIFSLVLIANYLYLPIRASQNPVLNWGNPVDIERIFRHISGFQYQVWLFSSIDTAKRQFVYYFSNLPKEFYISLFISLVGIFYSMKNFRRFFIFNIILFSFTILYSINYDINDIDSYFLLSYFSVTLFFAMGILWIYKKYSSIRNNFRYLIILLFPLVQLLANYSSVNQTDNYIYEDYTKALLKSLPENSIVFGYQWDYFISPAYYFQFVENFRKDVAVIDKELLRRSWYFEQIETSYPDVLTGVKVEINMFLEALKPFERKENYNAALLESLFRRIMTNLLSTNITKREFHLTPEIIENEIKRGEFTLPEGVELVPYLLTFKAVNDKKYIEAPLPDFQFRVKKAKDKYQTAIINIVSSMLVNRAIYEKYFDKEEKAKMYLKRALEINSEVIVPMQLRHLIYD